MGFNSGMYYSWPMMNYYSNQMMFPNYSCPSPTYWGVQQTMEMPHSESMQTKTAQHTSVSTYPDYELCIVIKLKICSSMGRCNPDLP